MSYSNLLKRKTLWITKKEFKILLKIGNLPQESQRNNCTTYWLVYVICLSCSLITKCGDLEHRGSWYPKEEGGRYFGGTDLV